MTAAGRRRAGHVTSQGMMRPIFDVADIMKKRDPDVAMDFATYQGGGHGRRANVPATSSSISSRSPRAARPRPATRSSRAAAAAGRQGDGREHLHAGLAGHQRRRASRRVHAISVHANNGYATSTNCTSGRRACSTERLRKLPQLADVATDQQNGAATVSLTIDRDQAARFGIQPSLIDATLYDAIGQRQVAQYFTQVNNYRIIFLEVHAADAGRSGAVRQALRRFAAHGRPGPAVEPGEGRHQQERTISRSVTRASTRR